MRASALLGSINGGAMNTRLTKFYDSLRRMCVSAFQHSIIECYNKRKVDKVVCHAVENIFLIHFKSLPFF